MIERLFRIPMLFTFAATVVALAWFLRPIDRTALYPVSFSDGKMGYVSVDGRVVFADRWRRVYPFDAEGMGIVVMRWESRIIDRSGRTVAAGDCCWPFDVCGLARVDRDERCGYVDRTGRLAIATAWDEGEEFTEAGLAKVKKGGCYGFIDREGTIVVPIEWDLAEPFRSSLTRVQRGGKWGYVDRQGRVAIAPAWDHATEFEDASGLAFVRNEKEKYQAIDRTGKPVEVEDVEEWDEIVGFGTAELAIVRRDILYGAIDRNGKTVVAPIWNQILPFDASGMAAAFKRQSHGYIDRAGKILVPIEWDYAGEFGPFDLAVAASGENYGYIDRSGRIAIPLTLMRAWPFHESGLAEFLGHDGRYGFLDRTGRVVLDITGNNVMAKIEFHSGGGGPWRIVVRENGATDRREPWFRALLAAAEKVGWKMPERTRLCDVYDTDGRLVWSSDWLSEPMWMAIAGIGIGLLGVIEICVFVFRKRAAV
jgi:WG containing repeat